MTNAPSQPFPALFPVFIPSLGQRQQQLGSPGSSPKATTQNTSLSFTSHPPLITSLTINLRSRIAHHGFLRRLVSPHPPTARKASTRNREPAAATATATLQLCCQPPTQLYSEIDIRANQSLHTAASSTSSPVSSWSSAVSASSSTLECERKSPREEAFHWRRRFENPR